MLTSIVLHPIRFCDYIFEDPKYMMAIFTARKRSCGKVMFLNLSVILFTGEVSGSGCGGGTAGSGGVHP